MRKLLKILVPNTLPVPFRNHPLLFHSLPLNDQAGSSLPRGALRTLGHRGRPHQVVPPWVEIQSNRPGRHSLMWPFFLHLPALGSFFLWILHNHVTDHRSLTYQPLLRRSACRVVANDGRWLFRAEAYQAEHHAFLPRVAPRFCYAG